LAETGGGWGLILLLGFALGGLLVVFRTLRVRGLPG
jgi:cbb3-type cytochrome oxidase subunit 3